MAIPVLGAYIEALSKYGATERAKMAAPSMTLSPRNTERQTDLAWREQQKIEAQRLKLQKQQLTTQQKSLKVQQDQAKLKKGQGILDIDQAGILAALQGKITDNEKLRLELQLALLTGNAKEADRLSNALLLSQAQTTGLASFIANLPKALNPFADYPFYVQKALEELAKVKNAMTAPQTFMETQNNLASELRGYGIESGAAQGLAEASMRLQAQADAYFKANPNINPMTGAVINVNVEVGGQQLTDIVTTQQLDNSASGIRSSINRTNFAIQ
jgi:hypothetical protein